MRLGYIWLGPGALTEKQQRDALLALGCAEKDIGRDKHPGREERDFLLTLIRPGDELCVIGSRYIADDAGELHGVLAEAAGRGGGIYLMSLGAAYTSTPELAAMTQEFVQAGKDAQTRKAREKLAKLPKNRRGGRPQKAVPKGREDEFVELWMVDGNTLNFMAKTFQTSVPVVKRWAAERGLPEK